jgi:hypothetical protein
MGNVLRKVAATGEEESAGTASSHADLVALLQAAAAADLRKQWLRWRAKFTQTKSPRTA